MTLRQASPAWRVLRLLWEQVPLRVQLPLRSRLQVQWLLQKWIHP